MATPSVSPPLSFTRLKQITNDACHLALAEAEYYDHSKTESWNTTIINSILRSLISESSSSSTTTTMGGTPSFKYTVNSTIIQHLVPTSAIQRARAMQESSLPKSQRAETSTPTSATSNSTKNDAIGTDGRPHVGRRGMHSATGAYWNEKTDGMWSFKYEGGDDKGLDVVISIVWIAV